MNINIQSAYAKRLISLAFLTNKNIVSAFNKERLPLIDESKLEHLMYSSVNSPDSIYIYMYFRYFGGKEYLDVYFAGCFDDEVGYYRIVLEPGKRLNPDDEELFIALCTDPRAKTTLHLIDLFNSCVKEHYPDVHLEGYKTPRSVGKALVSFYFSLLNSGVFEILYKASFKTIPEHIMEIYDVNFIGTNPSDIISKMPIKLLRILDNKQLVYTLFTEAGQKEAIAVFNRYASYLNDNIPYPSQWMYMCRINAEGIDFDRKVYDVLCNPGDIRVVDEYINYFKLKEEMFDYFPQENGVPEVSNICRMVRELVTIKGLVEHEEYYDYQVRNSAPDNVYEFDNDTYIVRFPKTIKEFTREAATQHNCLLDMYLENVLMGTACIGFIRKKESPNDSNITFSLYKRKICEARGRFNRKLTADERMFLDEYADAMGFEVSLAEERF